MTLGAAAPLAGAEPAPQAAPPVQPAQMMLAQQYRGQAVAGWLMSEKLDGVRAFWDGRQLIGRSGKAFTAPAWFTQGFPPFALDGELFAGRGRFELAAAAVHSSDPQAWQPLHYAVFDVPNAAGGLLQRLQVLRDYLSQSGAVGAEPGRIRIVQQRPVADAAAAQAFLREIEAGGGEGVMLRHPQAAYPRGRSELLLKMKSAHDAECVVVAHHPGRGRLQGLLGSLSCENAQGRFRIGSGFSDRERSDPPPIGSTITYRYRGLTAKGLPRFASFVRIRPAQGD
ncbi:DNA ligase [Vandammella animalimorsus]|uniref:DNA ligase n=2 Tax=Vandammella animalimorsus TaxID=2029117 RepID=A0A3M6R8P1_9BURK|nr:DNA ligase [Vandammella animalimorsus]